MSGFHVNPRGLVRALATVVVVGVGVGGAVVALAVADAANASARVADAMSARRRWAVLMWVTSIVEWTGKSLPKVDRAGPGISRIIANGNLVTHTLDIENHSDQIGV